MILAKNCNSRHPIPLRFGSEKNYKKASYETNKHNFLCFSPPKVLYYYVCSWVGIWEKKIIQRHGENISFCVSLKSLLFEVVIVNLGLEGSNLKILRLGRAHMPRNIQNYWFLTKKHHVKKSVPQIYNSPRALALKQSKDGVP